MAYCRHDAATPTILPGAGADARVDERLYVAVIAVLLTYLRSGQRPGVYEFRCLAWVARGVMSVATMQKVLARRQRQRNLDKARRLAKQAVKTQG